MENLSSTLQLFSKGWKKNVTMKGVEYHLEGDSKAQIFEEKKKHVPYMLKKYNIQ